MEESEQFSSLISNIYDASLDPTLWHSVLKEVAGFVGGQSAGIGSMNSATKSFSNTSYCFGCDPHYLQLQIEEYAKCDPAGMLCFFAPEQVVSVGDFMPYEEYLETRFFQEWARPQGLVDSLNVVLEKSSSSFSFFSIYRNDRSGRVDDAALQRMRLIVPHVRRAAAISNVLEHKIADAATLADTLDTLEAAMFLIDARGYIIHANAPAQAMLVRCSPLRSVAGKLAACDVKAESALRNAVSACAERSDRAIGAGKVAVPLRSENGENYVAYTLPLTNGARRGAHANHAAVAAVFVQKAAARIWLPPELLAKNFNLTPSELRVLLAIVEVGGIPRASEMLGLSEGTVKAHLKRVFAKTCTNSQGELVKLVMGVSRQETQA